MTELYTRLDSTDRLTDSEDCEDWQDWLHSEDCKDWTQLGEPFLSIDALYGAG